MDDILASIRRILAEDETPRSESSVGPEAPAASRPEVLDLDPSMLVEEPPPSSPQPHASPHATETAALREPPFTRTANPPPLPRPDHSEPLVAPEAAAATAASVGTLVRHLATERSLSVTRQGPSLEDVIRDEIRPLLKQWLDHNLPPMVERLVRAEIARVVDRSVT